MSNDKIKDMKKPHTKRHLLWLDLIVALVTIILVITSLVFGFKGNDKSANDFICKTIGSEHQLSVSNDTFSPSELTLKRCDTIMIVNKGTEIYEFAFGVHEKHVEYPGFTMQSLHPNEYFIIDAVQAGTYTLHDHLRDKARIEFDIKIPD